MGWHGRLFENFRNDFLDAVPHEIVQRGGKQGLLRRNQFGLNVSGPVVIPHLYNGGRATFFSFSYEAMRETIARTYLRTVPTMPERTGDWSSVVDQAGQLLPIYDPATTAANPAYDPSQPVSPANLAYTRTPYPGNRIPASGLDPVAQQQLRFYPAPNSDAGPFFRNNYFILAPEQNRADGVITRLDHNIRERHRLGGSLNFSNGVDGAAPWFPTIANPGPVSRDRRSRRLSIDHVFTLSPRSVNTLTLEAATSQTANLPLLDQKGEAFPYYLFQPYLSMGTSYPVSRSARHTFQITDGFSTRWRQHRLRAIFAGVQEQTNSYWPQHPSGEYRFSAGLTSLPGIVNTGHAFASFLTGGAEYAERSIVTAPSYFRRTRGTIALRDQWELRQGLTLSFGLNFEFTEPRLEKYDRQSTVSFSQINPANGLPGAVAVASHGGFGRAFQPVVWSSEQTLGLAWNVLGSARTVARVNYSHSFSPPPLYQGQFGTQAFNGTITRVSPNPQLTPAATVAAGLPTSGNYPDLRPESANFTVADLIEPTGRQSSFHSASASLEKELPGALVLTAGTSHTTGEHLLLGNTGSNPNAIHLPALAFRDLLNDEQFNRSQRPFPQYQRFEVFNSYPEGDYQRDAGFLRLEKRTSAGLSLAASYEFSKQFDNYSGPYGVQDYYNRQNEWSLSAGNNPHRLSLTYMYELPLGAGKMWLQMDDWRRYLVDGWSVSGVTTVASGEPLALRPQFNNTGGVVDALHVDTVPGVDPNVPNQGPELWFNPAAFSHPEDFTTGAASRTHPHLRNPGNQNHDLAINKRIAIAQDRSVEFSAAGFNFINNAVWTDPDVVIGTAHAPNLNAGRIIGSRGSRVIQLGLRVSF